MKSMPQSAIYWSEIVAAGVGFYFCLDFGSVLQTQKDRQAIAASVGGLFHFIHHP